MNSFWAGLGLLIFNNIFSWVIIFYIRLVCCKIKVIFQVIFIWTPHNTPLNCHSLTMWPWHDLPTGTPMGHCRQSIPTANGRRKLHLDWSYRRGSSIVCPFYPQAGDSHPDQVYAQETQLPEPLQDKRVVQGTVCTLGAVPLGAGFVWVLLGKVWVKVVVVLGSLTSPPHFALHGTPLLLLDACCSLCSIDPAVCFHSCCVVW